MPNPLPQPSSSLAAVACLGALAAQDPAASAQPEPHPWFETIHVNLGTKMDDEALVATFPFTNPLDQAVEWTGFRSSAVRTATVVIGDQRWPVGPKEQRRPTNAALVLGGAKPGAKGQVSLAGTPMAISVPPNATGTIELQMVGRPWQPSSRGGLRFRTTDPACPTVRLQVEAEIVPVFNQQPRRIELGPIRWDETTAFRFELTCNTQNIFAVAGHEPLPEGVTLDYRQEIKDGRSVWTVSGTVGPFQRAPSRGIVLRLLHHVRDRKPLPIDLNLDVIPPVTCVPKNVLPLGIIQQGRGTTQTVRFEPLDQTPLKVTGVRFTDLVLAPDIVQAAIRQDGNAAVVDVIVPPNLKVGTVVGGTIRITVDHPAAPEQAIRFSGIVR